LEHPHLRYCSNQQPQTISGSQAKILTMVLRGGYIVRRGAFHALKNHGHKPLPAAPKSHACMMSYPTTIGGRSIIIPPDSNPEKNSINEKGLLVETSTQCINKKHGSYDRGDRVVIPRYHDGWFPLAGPY
jgi:hypothetical protein